LKIMIL